MTLVRFNGTPSAAFPYGNLLNEFLTDLGTVNGGDVRKSSPSVNVAETADAYRLEVAAPGLTKEAFKIHVEDEVLSVSGEQPALSTSAGNLVTAPSSVLSGCPNG